MKRLNGVALPVGTLVAHDPIDASRVRGCRAGDIPIGVAMSSSRADGTVDVMLGGFGAISRVCGGTHVPPPRQRWHDPNCHHCGAPRSPSSPRACRYCGTERA